MLSELQHLENKAYRSTSWTVRSEASSRAAWSTHPCWFCLFFFFKAKSTWQKIVNCSEYSVATLPLFYCKEQWRFVIKWRGRSVWDIRSQDPAPLCGLVSFQWIFSIGEIAQVAWLNHLRLILLSKLCGLKSIRGISQHSHLPVVLSIYFFSF